MSFDSSLRISCKRSHSMNYLCPPATTLLMTGHVCQAVESLRKMTGEVTFPGGGMWGPERQTTSVPHSPAGGRVPSGLPQQSPCPAPPGPDMGQLITALTLALQISTPKISTFSGDVAPSKTEVSYKPWSHKVQCIKDHYPESVVRERCYAVSERSSGRHGPLHGPYCQCLQNFGETHSNIWHGCII